MLRISPRGQRLQGLLPSTLLDLVSLSPFRFSYLPTNRHVLLPIRLRNGRRWSTQDTNPLTSFRIAIGENDTDEAKRICREMVDNQTLGMITYRDWMALSFLLENPAQQFPSDLDKYEEELSIHCAAYGFINTLKSYMSLHFEAGDYDKVLSLYDRYFIEYERIKAPISQTSQVDDSVSDLMSDQAIPLDDNLQFKYTPPAVAELLVFAVAASAVQNDFDGAFRRIMDSPTIVRVEVPRVMSFCNAQLVNQPDVARRVREWIQELVLCRLISRHSSLETYLMNLAQDNNTSVLRGLYERVIENCDNPDRVMCLVQRSPEESDRSKTLAVPSYVWASFLQAFFRCNRHDLVGKVWMDLKSRGLIPDQHIRNALLKGFGRYYGDLEKAIAVWNDMLAAGIEPNDVSYGAMIQAYFRNRKPAEALALFDQFRKVTSKGSNGQQELRGQALLPLYNTVLHGLLTNNSLPVAQGMLEDLRKHGVEPDIVTYNTFLRFYGRVGNLQALNDILHKMKESGIDPDVYSFTTVLSALYKKGKHDAHTRLLNIMMSMGIRPNVAMYSAIIDFLVREGGRANFQNAVLLLHHMENDADKASRPNEITYTALLAGIHRDSSLTADEVKMYTQDIFGRMRRSGTLPNRVTYHCLIKASLENPEARGLQLGLGYYREMNNRGIVITNRTWYVLLSSLIRRGDVYKAVEVLNDMHRKGHQPDDSLSILVDKVQAMVSAKRM